MTVDITFFSKPDCDPCDVIRSELEEIGKTIPVNVTEIDVTAEEAAYGDYTDSVPIIRIGAQRLEAPIDTEDLKVALVTAAAEQAASTKEPVTGNKRKVVIALDRGILWFSRRWVILLSILSLLYAGIPFLAPVAIETGHPMIARAIYRLYSPLCHQFAFRSWFLYGEQAAYPREAAGVEGGSFEDYASRDQFFDGVDVHTLDDDLIYAAKQFVGNEEMGWKVAFCERDVAIYTAIALSGFLFMILKRAGVKVPYLPFWAYVLIALVPMGIDGVSQFFANPPFNGFGLAFYPIRESTPLLRVITGALFGLGNAWLAIPYVDDSMEETEELVLNKLKKAGKLPFS
ncbi:MAG: DUF2085 domain-containing protein [Anaerolineae bacterium]|nr:DUF2085 domain-containing protein [Anaerolineae bacterium]